MTPYEKLQGLYVITDDTLTPSETMFDQVKAALEGGANIVQLRDKVSSDEQIERSALELQKLCESYGAMFVLNDKVELAIKLKLHGLHIGKSDYYRLQEIRNSFDGIIGVSCYDDVGFAKEMEKMGMDYVAFGSFFYSPTKPNSNVVSLKTLSHAKQELNIPVCAIGGITRSNIAMVKEHNPDMVAVVSDIWKNNDAYVQSSFYAKSFKLSNAS